MQEETPPTTTRGVVSGLKERIQMVALEKKCPFKVDRKHAVNEETVDFEFTFESIDQKRNEEYEVEFKPY